MNLGQIGQKSEELSVQQVSATLLIKKNEVTPIIKAPKQSTKVVYKKRKIKPVPLIKKLNRISYTEAFMKYHNGNLIQFTENCQSSPSRMVIANGSDLMLDNRSPNKEVISIANIKYTLDPYGFEIIRLNSPKTPVTNLIDCTVSRNVNTLIIE